ncbi:MAG: UDP-N-acetyl glucosamine 2-epimerase, partial [Pyrinomonadaceae bacterium]
TDAISDLLLTTSQDADENLKAEGVPQNKIKFVGNVMIDSVFYNLEKSKESKIREDLNLTENEYAVTTLHRPSNVDDKQVFTGLLDALVAISEKIPVIFPVHPRTRNNIEKFGFAEQVERSNIKLINPLGYLDFMRLYSGAKLVLTDSGGLQEETTALGIPCLTLRENTERPITIELGTNQLVGMNPAKIKQAAFEILENTSKTDKQIPPLWDGHAAERICESLLEKN